MACATGSKSPRPGDFPQSLPRSRGAQLQLHMSNTAETAPTRKHDTARMRSPLLACSVLAGVVGCLLFHVGGFMLLPVALDLWYQAMEAPAQPAVEPVDPEHVR